MVPFQGTKCSYCLRRFGSIRKRIESLANTGSLPACIPFSVILLDNWNTYVDVAALSLAQTLSRALSTLGGVFARSSAEIPPFSSLTSAMTCFACSRVNGDIFGAKRGNYPGLEQSIEVMIGKTNRAEELKMNGLPTRLRLHRNER